MNIAGMMLKKEASFVISHMTHMKTDLRLHLKLRFHLDTPHYYPRLLASPAFDLSALSLQDLATPQAFSRNSSRVWEFYHYWRELALKAKPSPVHLAIAECEARLRQQGRSMVVITQNTDELHRRAGSKHVLEVHGEPRRGWNHNRD